MMLKEPVDKGPWVRRRREGTLALGGGRDSSAVSSTQAKLARNGRELLRATHPGGVAWAAERPRQRGILRRS